MNKRKRKVKRVILDTNIYGNLSKERNPYALTEKLMKNNDFVFYGIRVVINRTLKLRNPEFIDYKKFKRLFSL